MPTKKLFIFASKSFDPKPVATAAESFVRKPFFNLCVVLQSVWPVKSCQMSIKMPKNDFSRKMKDFDTFAINRPIWSHCPTIDHPKSSFFAFRFNDEVRIRFFVSKALARRFWNTHFTPKFEEVSSKQFVLLLVRPNAVLSLEMDFKRIICLIPWIWIQVGRLELYQQTRWGIDWYGVGTPPPYRVVK